MPRRTRERFNYKGIVKGNFGRLQKELKIMEAENKSRKEMDSLIENRVPVLRKKIINVTNQR